MQLTISNNLKIILSNNYISKFLAWRMMKISDVIKIAREKNLGRKGIKKRVKDLKKSSYGKNWQVVGE